jgi:acyl-[acyl carrier protein]--UDP-N-acetylglucosamine O-acyltransferase
MLREDVAVRSFAMLREDVAVRSFAVVREDVAVGRFRRVRREHVQVGCLTVLRENGVMRLLCPVVGILRRNRASLK